MVEGFGFVTWPEGRPELAKFYGRHGLLGWLAVRRSEFRALCAGMRRNCVVRPVAASDNPVVVARICERSARQFRASKGYDV